MSLPDYAQTDLPLPAMASWPASRHLFDDDQRAALRAAEAAGRPLLVRGEPGTGKSQLAHAAAVASGRAFLPFVVDSRTEATDLMWRFDAIARLSDAHLSGVPNAGVPQGLGPKHYVQPGPLWWAFNWADARIQLAHLRTPGTEPEVPENWTPRAGCVLLVDEIDKAEAELPNGLLEALGNGRFSVQPMHGHVVRRDETPENPVPPPLVIITTNDERELPAAFLRRCLVLTLRLPQGGALREFLLERGRLHFGDWARAHDQALSDAADLLIEDRGRAEGTGLYKPGLAEYLDLLRALKGLGGDPLVLLARLRPFVFHKQPDNER